MAPGVDSLASGLRDRLQIDGATGDATGGADDSVLHLVDSMLEKVAGAVVDINNNTEQLLGKEVNFHDSFGRIT